LTLTSIDPRAAFAAVQRRLHEVVALDPLVAEAIVVSLLARGHMLIEGIPGIGKTLLARTLAAAVDCEFHRIQFTNDLMPSDIVGSVVWRPAAEKFVFVRGPLFAQIVLADEINRTSPRTLSCLLEAMENGQVSVEGRTVPLPSPFFVIATRNPIEFQGTFPIPEAALDRFLVRVELRYPQAEQELALYRGRDPETLLKDLAPVLPAARLLEAIEEVGKVQVSEPVAAYAYEVVQRTRAHDAVLLGASPRAALMWLKAARARAWLHGREHVLPDDLKALARAVLAHRTFLKGGGDAGEIVQAIVQGAPVPL
jgi:MoxR-like ATPase